MKKLLSLLLALTLMLSLGAGYAAASDFGELDIDWQPDSLGDDPGAPEYGNVYVEPAETYAAAYALDDWGEEDSGTSGEAAVYAAAMELEIDGEAAPSVTKPSTRRANESSPTAGDSHYYTESALAVDVADQGSRSICWAVAAMDCLQIGAKRDGVFPLGQEPALSAEHLVYYAYHGFTDSLCNPERDYITPADDRGNVYASLVTLASWAGAASALDTGKDNDIYADNQLWLENGCWLRFSGSDDRAAVKAAVLEHGGVAASLIAGTNFTESSGYYNAETNAFCYTGAVTTNTDHEIVIVGWDDDYSAANFLSMPVNDDGEALNGAWLCRNTWGRGWGDGGYFWLSYYDAGLCAKGVAVVLDASRWGAGMNLYQYDGSYTLWSREKLSSGTVTIANVYTAGDNSGAELLRAVGTYSAAPGTAYTAAVYVGLTDPADPASGYPAASASGVFPYAGYHSIRLEKQPLLDKGTVFSVVFTLTYPTGSGNELPICVSHEATAGGVRFTAHNSAGDGESFRLDGDAWTDRSAAAGGGVNYRIKAYTVPDSEHTHSWTDTVAQAATCTEAGVLRRECGCGAVRMEAIPAAHTLEHVPAAEPTAVAPGSAEHWYCTVCEKYFADKNGETEIPQSDAILPAKGFSDVKDGEYYCDAVRWAVENKVTTGATDTTFDPRGKCSRAQIVTFLWRAAGEPQSKGETTPFTDVKPGTYYYDAVLWAAENGIANGMTATTFEPNRVCTRAQVVTFLWRAAGEPQPAGKTNPFTDVSSGAYYYDAVLWAVENKITSGMTDTLFGPGYTCQRAQAVTFLYRAAGE